MKKGNYKRKRLIARHEQTRSTNLAISRSNVVNLNLNYYILHITMIYDLLWLVLLVLVLLLLIVNIINS